MNNFLVWLGGLVTVCLGLLFAGPHFIDWNQYRGVIETEASRFFGHRVRVGGQVNVRILPVPYVSFEKLSIADTNSNSGAPIVRADTFKMWLSVPPLLQGVIEAHQIDVHRPVIELVTNEQGGGNWQNLRLRTETIAFMPAGFALDALDISNGTIVLRSASGSELTRFHGINGTLSAAALQGPFKFNGNFEWREIKRQLRLSTARIADNGDVRLKASLATPSELQRGRKVLLDGVFNASGGKPKFTGEVTAKLAGFQSRIRSDQPAAQVQSKSAKPSTFDLRSQIQADTRSLRLEDINLALETDGPPQLMTGRAKLDWTSATTLDVDLSSRWIDFDRFTVSDSTAAPLENARQLLVALGRSLPEQADTNVKVVFDQATLGGQSLGSIQLAAVRNNGPLKLKEFEANVPGGGVVTLSGSLLVSNKAPSFNGRLSADGQSLMKFLRWGMGDANLGEGLADGPFAIDSTLQLTETSFALRKATVDFGDTPVSGDLEVNFSDRRRIALNLEGHTLKWDRFSAHPFDIDAYGNLVEDSGGESKPETLFAGIGNHYDIALDLRAAKLIDGNHEYRDVVGSVQIVDGKVSVPILQFAHNSGLQVDIGAEDARPRGAELQARQIKGIVSAKTRIAMVELLRFLRASDFEPVLRQRLLSMAPLRLATIVDFGTAETAGVQIKLDGTAHGGRLVADLELANGLSEWRTSPLTLAARLENKSAGHILKLVSKNRVFSNSSQYQNQPGRFDVKAEGIPAQGVLTRAVMTAPQLSFNYYGDLKLSQGSPVTVDGKLNLKSDSARDAMAVLGFDLGAGVSGVPVAGTVSVHRKDQTLRFSTTGLNIDQRRLQGDFSLTEQTNAPAKLMANVQADRASLPSLLRIILAPDRLQSSGSVDETEPSSSGGLIQNAAATEAAVVQDARRISLPGKIWPDQQFDFSPLMNVEGYVTAKFSEFAFGAKDDLTLTDTRLEATLAPGKVSVTELTGQGLGGDTTFAFTIAKAPAGVDIDGTAKMRIGKSAAKSPNDRNGEATATPTPVAAPTYAAIFDLNYKGRAFAPSGLAADMEGSGKLTLADATLTGLTAKELRDVVAGTMKSPGPIESQAFTAELKSALKEGEIKLGSLQLPVTMKSGAVSLAPIELSGADGTTTFISTLDIASLKFDSEWKITALDPEAKAGSQSNPVSLPPVMVTYVGELSNLMEVEPRLSTGALEREIAVRKMERDVAELERLRKLDEENAKQEQERRRQIEARLAEQRRLEAERQRRMEQELREQQNSGNGSEALPPVGTLDGGDLRELDQQELAVPAPAKPKRRIRRPPPPEKNIWNPFQITPY